jgi:starch phosphorylase
LQCSRHRKSRPRKRFEAVARSVRDILSQRWLLPEKTYQRQNPKRVSYLSMEFLLGRCLANNITNLLLTALAKEAAGQREIDWRECSKESPMRASATAAPGV